MKITTPLNKKKKAPYYISKKIKQQLDSSKKSVMEEDQDRVFIVTGREGSGKSTLAFQLAYYLDRTFCLDDVCFNAEDFAKKVRNCPKYKAIVFDEAFNGLSSRGALSHQNKSLLRLLQECRQRNLYIFIILPSFFLLEIYVGIFRSAALFHTNINKKNRKLRFYKVYNERQKEVLYRLGKKTSSYYYPKIKELHNFFKTLPPTMSIEEYKKKKYDAFKFEAVEAEKPIKYKVQRDDLLMIMNKEYKISQGEIARRLKAVSKYPITQQAIALTTSNKPKL
jgi:hypothetical protein